jgi:DNA-binding CsgD family transcriptional regulator
MDAAVLQCADRLDAARNIEDAWGVAVQGLAKLGVSWCHYAHVALPGDAQARPAALMRLSTLPEAWRAHHTAMSFWRVDAAVRHCATSLAVMPTGLGFARAAGDTGWARMCADAEAIGLGDGLAVPLRGLPGAAYGAFSLITAERGAGFAAWRRTSGTPAVLIAHLAAQRLMLLAEAEAPRRPRLSPRERECLLWLVAGLRSDRIAERLGLSRATVDLHLSRARRRLGARTREQAVARALMFGLLTP